MLLEESAKIIDLKGMISDLSLYVLMETRRNGVTF